LWDQFADRSTIASSLTDHIHRNVVAKRIYAFVLLRDGAATGLEVWVAVLRPELLRVVRNELQHRRNTNGPHLGIVEHET
jgi:hypothetical protein